VTCFVWFAWLWWKLNRRIGSIWHVASWLRGTFFPLGELATFFKRHGAHK
jgi:hypothetical protein